MKQKFGCLATALVIFLAPWILVFTILPLKFDGTWHATENPADYGIIRDNCDNTYPEEFLMSFFPENLEPYFENVVYEYKAYDWCDYNCEMYLEFTISDPEQFQRYVTELTAGLTGQEFPYNRAYTDYIIANVLYVEPAASSRPENPNYFLRNGARMGRILVCAEEQKIICVGMVVSTCCGGFSDDYDFYERFGIDPQEYSDRFCDSTAY